jgi:hypothetical protein
MLNFELITRTAVMHYFKIVGCHSCDVEDSGLLGCYAMLTGKYIVSGVWRNIMPQNPGVSRRVLLLGPKGGGIT